VRLDGGILGAVVDWCRQVGAVQGVRLRQGRRSGAGVAKLRCGDGLLLLVQLEVLHPLALLLPLLFFSSSSAGAATAAREKQGVGRVLDSGLGGS
jgi:hypothetical protein